MPNPLLRLGAVTTPKLADGAVTAANIAPGAVGYGQLAGDSVGMYQIRDHNVSATELAVGAVGADALKSYLLHVTTAQAQIAGGCFSVDMPLAAARTGNVVLALPVLQLPVIGGPLNLPVATVVSAGALAGDGHVVLAFCATAGGAIPSSLDVGVVLA